MDKSVDWAHRHGGGEQPAPGTANNEGSAPGVSRDLTGTTEAAWLIKELEEPITEGLVHVLDKSAERAPDRPDSETTWLLKILAEPMSQEKDCHQADPRLIQQDTNNAETFILCGKENVSKDEKSKPKEQIERPPIQTTGKAKCEYQTPRRERVEKPEVKPNQALKSATASLGSRRPPCWTTGQGGIHGPRVQHCTKDVDKTQLVQGSKGCSTIMNKTQAARDRFENLGMNHLKKTKGKPSLREIAKQKQAEWRKSWAAKSKHMAPVKKTQFTNGVGSDEVYINKLGSAVNEKNQCKQKTSATFGVKGPHVVPAEMSLPSKVVTKEKGMVRAPVVSKETTMTPPREPLVTPRKATPHVVLIYKSGTSDSMTSQVDALKRAFMSKTTNALTAPGQKRKMPDPVTVPSKKPMVASPAIVPREKSPMATSAAFRMEKSAMTSPAAVPREMSMMASPVHGPSKKPMKTTPATVGSELSQIATPGTVPCEKPKITTPATVSRESLTMTSPAAVPRGMATMASSVGNVSKEAMINTPATVVSEKSRMATPVTVPSKQSMISTPATVSREGSGNATLITLPREMSGTATPVIVLSKKPMMDSPAAVPREGSGNATLNILPREMSGTATPVIDPSKKPKMSTPATVPRESLTVTSPAAVPWGMSMMAFLAGNISKETMTNTAAAFLSEKSGMATPVTSPSKKPMMSIPATVSRESSGNATLITIPRGMSGTATPVIVPSKNPTMSTPATLSRESSRNATLITIPRKMSGTATPVIVPSKKTMSRKTSFVTVPRIPSGTVPRESSGTASREGLPRERSVPSKRSWGRAAEENARTTGAKVCKKDSRGKWKGTSRPGCGQPSVERVTVKEEMSGTSGAARHPNDENTKSSMFWMGMGIKTEGETTGQGRAPVKEEDQHNTDTVNVPPAAGCEGSCCLPQQQESSLCSCNSDLTVARDEEEEAVPVPIPQPKVVHVTDMNVPKVYFDFETTGFGMEPEMIQLAAVGPQGEFNRYMLPRYDINFQASQLTGLTVRDDRMYLRGEEVETTPNSQVLREFLQFLGDVPVLLIGHNITHNDATMLLQWSQDEDVELSGVVHGFLDTFRMFKNLHKGLSSYTQSHLYSHFFPMEEDFNAHNALDDVLTLRLLVDHACPDPTEQRRFTFQLPYLEELQSRSFRRSVDSYNWSRAIRQKSITKYMMYKAVDSGLKFRHLRQAFRRGGEEGLTALLSQPLGDTGTPRVTKTKDVIDKIVLFFQTNDVEM